MSESFLHYIWQFQYFDKTALTTHEGLQVEILNPGIQNAHAGPDFSNAKVRIDGMAWAGNVEIHTKASIWYDHLHDRDPAYENVVLHVVWQNDKLVYRQDRTLLPTIALKSRVDESLLFEYKKLVNNPTAVPCRKSFPQVDQVVKISMLDKALVQRLEARAVQIRALFRQNNNDWQETAYQVLARNFGFKVNGEPFFQLARAMPYKTLLKHADKGVQVEALLFGQAGLLDIAAGDEYYKLLQREYNVLSRKYTLSAKKLKRAHWRFLRLRPANFPTVRIAQFAALITRRKNVFSLLFEIEDFSALRELVSVSQAPYWQCHYQFNRKARETAAVLGDTSVDNLLINSITPLVVAYGKYLDAQPVVDRALGLLRKIPAENNEIIRIWKGLGYEASTAFDSQALIELYNNFCQRRNCLNCAVGASLLKPKS